MKFTIPNSSTDFTISCEVLNEIDFSFFKVSDFSYTFNDSTSVQLVPLAAISPPFRDGKKVWFRDDNTVLSLLLAMKNKDPLPPISVWNKGEKLSTFYSVRDGFHRFYLSIVMGYNFIPIRLDDWDFEV